MKRYVILAEEKFHYLLSKTGNVLIRYKPEEVVAVIDSTTAGQTASDVIGYGGDIPVVAKLEDTLHLNPDTLVIGIAPPGGILPDSWRPIICKAMEYGLNIISGLHLFLTEDEEFVDIAKKHGVTITDLRKPPTPLPFSKGSWRWRKTPVLLTVGSDCDSGKMTTAWELKDRLEKMGKKAVFVGTGQTGILLGGRGVAVDAVVSDFVAGVIEAEIDKVVSKCDLVIVEGQGALTHMAYSGVTLALLHGTMPDMMIMCHEPGRRLDTMDYPIPDLSEVMNMYQNLMRPFKKTVFVGISLLTHRLDENTALNTIAEYERKYAVPASDFVRFGGGKIVEEVLKHLK